MYFLTVGGDTKMPCFTPRFVRNAFLALGDIFIHHATNQSLKYERNRGSVVLRFLSPEPAKTLSMPANVSSWLNDH